LFLKTRYPKNSTIDELIKEVYGYESYNKLAKAAMDRFRKSFSDYRYQFKVAISKKVDDFKKVQRIQK